MLEKSTTNFQVNHSLVDMMTPGGALHSTWTSLEPALLKYKGFRAGKMAREWSEEKRKKKRKEGKKEERDLAIVSKKPSVMYKKKSGKG